MCAFPSCCSIVELMASVPEVPSIVGSAAGVVTLQSSVNTVQSCPPAGTRRPSARKRVPPLAERYQSSRSLDSLRPATYCCFGPRESEDGFLNQLTVAKCKPWKIISFVSVTRTIILSKIQPLNVLFRVAGLGHVILLAVESDI